MQQWWRLHINIFEEDVQCNSIDPPQKTPQKPDIYSVLEFYFSIYFSEICVRMTPPSPFMCCLITIRILLHKCLKQLNQFLEKRDGDLWRIFLINTLFYRLCWKSEERVIKGLSITVYRNPSHVHERKQKPHWLQSRHLPTSMWRHFPVVLMVI